jgi:hypothetical protein
MANPPHRARLSIRLLSLVPLTLVSAPCAVAGVRHEPPAAGYDVTFSTAQAVQRLRLQTVMIDGAVVCEPEAEGNGHPTCDEIVTTRVAPGKHYLQILVSRPGETSRDAAEERVTFEAEGAYACVVRDVFTTTKSTAVDEMGYPEPQVACEVGREIAKAGSDAPSDAEPVSPPSNVEPASTTEEPAAERCPKRPGRDEAIAAFDSGKKELDAARKVDEHIPADVFDSVVAKLRLAAQAGHIGAQSLLGTTVFGTLFVQDTPRSADRDAWIEAVMYLRTAALAGDSAALAFIPGLTSAMPPGSGEPPLGELPRDWLLEAWRRADAFVACSGKLPEKR